MKNLIKNKIPNGLKSELHYMFKTNKNDINMEKYKYEKKIFVFLAGFYQNLGDMALTFSQKTFLEENFPEYTVILIPSTETYQSIKSIKKIISKEDIITTIGGGNMDDIYTSLEDARRFVIKKFPENKVVSFPQTMIFSENPHGKKRLNKTVKTYLRHNNLHIFTREENSLARMREHFKGKDIGFVPDIVLYLDKSKPQFSRTGIITCMRNDKEKKSSIQESNQIIDFVKSKYNNVTVTDTVNVSLEEASMEKYEETLEDFWLTLKKAEVVVTDRLHCMIFCAITKTPCIVFDNTNKKISGVYNAWLKNLKFINMMDQIDLIALERNIENLKHLDLNELNSLDLKHEFKPLIDRIN